MKKLLYVCVVLLFWASCCGSAFADDFGVVIGKVPKRQWWQDIFPTDCKSRKTLAEAPITESRLLSRLKDSGIEPKITDLTSVFSDGTLDRQYEIEHGRSGLELFESPNIKRASITVPRFYSESTSLIAAYALVSATMEILCNPTPRDRQSFYKTCDEVSRSSARSGKDIFINNCKIHVRRSPSPVSGYLYIDVGAR
jgi:hypothetical protein